MFIVVEGIDGSGKTSLIEGLKTKIKNLKHEIVQTREPGGTPFSEKLREIILEIQANPKSYNKVTETCLLLLARDHHLTELIIPSLKKNKIVISDRFSLSTKAYQQYLAKIDQDIIKKLTKLIVKHPITPDLTFYLDLPAEIAYERVKDRSFKNKKLEGFDNKKIEFYQNVRNAYESAIITCDEEIIKIDATLSLEKNVDKVYKLVVNKFAKLNDKNSRSS